tara:strand:+ start:4606 stop:4989 length:384 start_codon:yes stop_codon:yes gene_type:complete
MKFHHIGYLTNNINNSFRDFKKLNYKKSGVLITDNLLKVKIQFLKNSNNLIELVKPDKINYGLKRILLKKNYAYHLAYKVNNLERSLKNIKKSFKIIVNPVPAKAFKGKNVAFIKIKDGFIIELIQS